jgi:hypothetical protein
MPIPVSAEEAAQASADTKAGAATLKAKTPTMGDGTPVSPMSNGVTVDMSVPSGGYMGTVGGRSVIRDGTLDEM